MSKTSRDPYLTAFALVKKHDGTPRQTALAKAILSVYNRTHTFSAGEILGSLDDEYLRAILNMFGYYATVGETQSLRTAGEWVYAE